MYDSFIISPDETFFRIFSSFPVLFKEQENGETPDIRPFSANISYPVISNRNPDGRESQSGEPEIPGEDS